MTDFQCPHCGQAGFTAARIESGEIGECAHCGRSFAFPSRLSHAGPLARPAAEAPLEPVAGQSAPTDIGLAQTFPIAAGVTLLFYLAIVWPLQGSYFGQLFAARGWVPYVIALLSVWAFVILVQKFRRYQEQVAVLGLDLLPGNLGERIDTGNVHVFESYLRHVSATMPRSYLVQRLIWAVRHFRMRGNVAELASQLGERTRADADAVDSSYSMLRVFIWAIPILGFIGTVLGIGTSVAAFSDSVARAADLEVMKNSIGSVTTGLGVAFDTTLLALVMSILIMFPSSYLEKAEEDFLARSEDYCDSHLMSRLEDAGTRKPAQETQTASLSARGSPAPDDPAERPELGRVEDLLDSLERRVARLEPSSEA